MDNVVGCGTGRDVCGEMHIVRSTRSESNAMKNQNTPTWHHATLPPQLLIPSSVSSISSHEYRAIHIRLALMHTRAYHVSSNSFMGANS